MWQKIQASTREYATRLWEKGLRYWATVVLLIAVCTAGSGYVYEKLGLNNFRANLFQWLLDHGPRPPAPKYVKVVLVGDHEYWEGEPAGRRPLKRTYLKSLIERLVADKAYVIALDFDLRTPNPTSTAIPREYEDETLQLITEIVADAAKGTKFVLATPIFYDGKAYRHDTDPYQAYGLCRPSSASIPKESEITPDLARAIREQRNKTIMCGYIYLPDNPLVVPSAITLDDNTTLDSFALAVAKAGWPEFDSVRELGSDIRYGNFIPEQKVENSDANVLFTAGSLLGHGPASEVQAVKSALEARPAAVIVGGRWSTYAVNRGPVVDMHATPVGYIPGAVLWANYTEAILDSRLYLFVPPGLLQALEVAFSVIAAIIFALSKTAPGKVLLLGVLSIVLLVIQWNALHGFAIFFDAYVPLLGIALHSLAERLIGVHGEVKKQVAMK